LLVAVVIAAVALSGCAKSGEDAGESETQEASDQATMEHDEGEHATVSNEGPKLDTEPVDAALAATGKEMFSAKGCTACHAFGNRVTGPDLHGVSSRRTRTWMTHWLKHPDEMLKTNPIAREMLATYATPMPNLNLTDDEVNALIEYMKQHNMSPAK
jgi:cytochrome c5